jgi:hypothetical protein
MNPLSYLGGGLGGSPTMPGAVPGRGGPPAPMMPPLPPGAIPAAPAGVMPMPPGAIPAGASPFLPPGSPEPEYGVRPQQDGTLVLYLKNPDGSEGPVLKVLNPPKPKTAYGQQPQGQPAR